MVENAGPTAAETRLLQQPRRVVDTEGGAEEWRDQAGDGAGATAEVDGHLVLPAKASGGGGDDTMGITIGDLHDMVLETGGQTVPVAAIHRAATGMV